MGSCSADLPGWESAEAVGDGLGAAQAVGGPVVDDGGFAVHNGFGIRLDSAGLYGRAVFCHPSPGQAQGAVGGDDSTTYRVWADGLVEADMTAAQGDDALVLVVGEDGGAGDAA